MSQLFASENNGGSGNYYSITPYIVESDIHSEFSSIQDAITQAITDGAADATPKNIYVKPGTYAEDLTRAVITVTEYTQ